jgi:protein-tyrosine phosphatase
MGEVTRILFVCVGNICRSPTAEAVFRHQAERAGWGGLFSVASAGISGIHAGEAPDPRTQRHAASRGYDLSRLRARQLGAEDFARFDLILSMAVDVHEEVRRLQRLADADATEASLFLDFLPGHEGRDVPDPYYGAGDGFETVLDLVEEGSHSLLRTLLKRQGVFGCGC